MDELIERVVGGAGHRLEQFKLGWEPASVPKHKLAGLQSGLVDIVCTLRTGRDIVRHKLDDPSWESEVS